MNHCTLINWRLVWGNMQSNFPKWSFFLLICKAGNILLLRFTEYYPIFVHWIYIWCFFKLIIYSFLKYWVDSNYIFYISDKLLIGFPVRLRILKWVMIFEKPMRSPSRLSWLYQTTRIASNRFWIILQSARSAARFEMKLMKALSTRSTRNRVSSLSTMRTHRSRHGKPAGY